jgi:iron complex transport system substrate-binding protein
MAPHHRSRLLRVVAPLFVAALVLTACNSAPPGPSGTFPATVTHRYGQTVVPEEPERVVSLGYTDQDAILALGTVPVAVREFVGNRPAATWPWAADRLKGEQPRVLPAGEVTPDGVAALRPDLIIAISAGLTREQYDAYSEIAPTVAAPDGVPDSGTPWRDATRLTGAALGLPGEADRLIADTEEKFLKAEEDNPELAGGTVAAVEASTTDSGAIAAASSKDLRGQFLAELGVQVPAEVDQLAGDGPTATLDADQLSALNQADALMVVGAEPERAAVTALPEYAQLPAVQDSKVVTLDDEESAALSFATVLSLPSVLDTLPPRLGRAVDR